MVEIGVHQQSAEESLENAEWYWGDITRQVILSTFRVLFFFPDNISFVHFIAK